MTVVARPGARRTVFSFKWLVILVALGALSAFFSSSYSRFMPEVRQTQTTVDKTTSIWTDHVVEHNAIPMKEEPQPVKNETKLVWLLSFPNSGTSYTMTNTLQTSQKSVVVNYEAEVRGRKVKAFPSIDASPFLLNGSLPLPHYALTKTHCAGFCEKCVPSLTANDFYDGCRSISYSLNGRKLWKSYVPEDLVAKAVHLFRNPQDNLVARKHLAMKRRREDFGWTEEQLAPYTDTPEGLKEWCRYVDSYFQGDMAKLMEERGVPEAVWKAVPCHTEWFRYVMWHNMAIKVLDRLQVPTLVIYYEDYTSRYEATVDSIFEFLELEQAADHAEFIPGKTYETLFEDETGRAATAFVKALAIPKCWRLIRHYFSAWDEQAKIETNTEEDSDENELDDDVADPAREEDQDPSVSAPETDLAWLLSFPNSGTTYTMQNTMHVSNATVAVNYAKELVKDVPIRPELTNGPFMQNHTLLIAPVTMTKSHCTGYCDECMISESVVTFNEFQTGCGQGIKRACETCRGFVPANYSPSIISKVIHLLRRPSDNIVSRMHHGVYRRRTFVGWSEEELAMFSNDRAGLKAWCDHSDSGFWKEPPEESSMKIVDVMWREIRQVPCHAEFFRYAQWHNHATAVIERLGVPAMTLYYEDYSTRYNETLKDIFEFLGIPMINEPLPFASGKTYDDFFTEQDLSTIGKLIRKLSTEKSWKLLERYFIDVDTAAES